MYQKSFSAVKGKRKDGLQPLSKSKSRNKFFSNSSPEQVDSSQKPKRRFQTSEDRKKPSYRNNRSTGRRSTNQNPISDYSKYIKKSSPVSEVEEYISKHKFADFALEKRLKENIRKKGYLLPTPIQDQAIPLVIEGRDVIGIANTGTGKTGAFIIPLIDKVFKNRKQKVLIIAPTRELASQIDMELRDFSKNMGIFSVQCIGGAGISRQIFDLQKNPQFVIGTPGRLNDLIQRGKLKLNNFENIVLDEVDRMVDMGFIDDIRKILSLLPQKRQSLFFSATVPPDINALIKTFMDNPVTVTVKSGETSDNVEQDIVRVGREQKKIEVLHELLIKKEFERVLIFGRTKRGVESLSNELFDRGFKSTSIHGDKPQSKREKALRLFKQKHLNILVATDVAARGLDIDDITHVINYDLPENYQDYIHRIGRTGRINKKGAALTFVN